MEIKVNHLLYSGVNLMRSFLLYSFSTDNVFQQRLHLVIRIQAAHQTQDHKAVHWVQVWVTQTIRWVRALRPSKQNNYQKQIYTLEVYNRERLIKIYTICVHSEYHFPPQTLITFFTFRLSLNNLLNDCKTTHQPTPNKSVESCLHN